MKRMKKEKGVTLIELLTVVVIIGIMASIAVPRFAKTIPRLRLKSDTKGIASTMRLARMRAVAERHIYGLYFDDTSSPQRFILFKDLDSDQVYNASQDSTIFTWNFYKTTNYEYIGPSNKVIVFSPNGSSNGGRVTLTAQSSSDTMAVDVLPSTGRVKVFK